MATGLSICGSQATSSMRRPGSILNAACASLGVGGPAGCFVLPAGAIVGPLRMRARGSARRDCFITAPSVDSAIRESREAVFPLEGEVPLTGLDTIPESLHGFPGDRHR